MCRHPARIRSVLAAKLTVENIDGNHIIMDIGDGVYAMYAHFAGARCW